MPGYKVSFPNNSIAREFEKQARKLPLKLQKQIKQKVDALAENPHPGIKSFKRLSPPLSYKDWTAHYRIRIGNYRILYDVDHQEKIVSILGLRKRGEKTYK
ncbi:hypothetical protein ES702_04262 [subsurface metagenome]